jgi:hypothetical protein
MIPCAPAQLTITAHGKNADAVEQHASVVDEPVTRLDQVAFGHPKRMTRRVVVVAKGGILATEHIDIAVPHRVVMICRNQGWRYGVVGIQLEGVSRPAIGQSAVHRWTERKIPVITNEPEKSAGLELLHVLQCIGTGTAIVDNDNLCRQQRLGAQRVDAVMQETRVGVVDGDDATDVAGKCPFCSCALDTIEVVG